MLTNKAGFGVVAVVVVVVVVVVMLYDEGIRVTKQTLT